MTDATAAGYATITLELEPLDVLFFRDGRPFDAAPRATGGLPMPQTLAGAVRTWLFGRLAGDLDTLAAAVRTGTSFADATAAQGPGLAVVGRIGLRGPWFASDGERLVPTPGTIEIDAKETLHRLDPLADDLPGWSPPMAGMRPLWRRSPGGTKLRGGWLRASGLERFLQGGVPRPDEIVDADALFAYEDRVGIGLDAATGTTDDGMIYAVRMMRLRPGVTLSVDLVGASQDLERCPDGEDVLALGGESRRAIVRRSAAPNRVTTAGNQDLARRRPNRIDQRDVRPVTGVGRGGGTLVLLTTPAPFGGWCPPGLSPVAAAVPGYVPVSGWDLARGGPKPTRFAVSAGSVYFLSEGADLSSRRGSLCAPEDASLGWGTCVEGVWDHG